MRRHHLVALLVFALVFTLVASAFAAPSNDDELLKDEAHRLEQAKKTYNKGPKAGSARNMRVVGHDDIGGRGFNADVWVHDGYAYVGQWGFTDWATGNTRFCPSGAKSGVAVLDVSDPSDPAVVARLQNPPGTSAEDVMVHRMSHGPFAGHDIAAAGIQVCGGSRYDTSFFRGLMLWDVTDPANPVRLGAVDTGCCTRGVHEFEVRDRDDLGRTFAYASVPASEYDDVLSPSGRRDQQGRGDFRLIDITNPAAPFELSDWGVLKDAGGPLGPGQGCDADPVFGHGAEPSDDGTLAFVAYWDSGFVALDVTDPTNPTLLGDTDYPANADGDAHSSSYDDARELLFAADEDFCKTSGPGIEKGFGYLRVYDYSDLSSPVQIGTFKTANSSGPKDLAAGDYTIHNPLVVGTDVLISWYSDGVRVVNASDPRRPREVAFFVPPAGQNPVKPSQRGVLTNTAQVWGVAYDHATGLIYASDMNSGLWVLRRTD